MKNLYLWNYVLVFLCASLFAFMSCSTDTDLNSYESSNNVFSRAGDIPPSNATNPYDITGFVYTELFEAYYAGDSLGSTILEIANDVQDIADANSSFNALKKSTYQGICIACIEYILDHQSTCVFDIISATNMSRNTKESLNDFTTSYIALFDREQDVAILYQAILAYESEVIESYLYTEADKEILLTTSSIMRYSSYRAKKKPKKNTDPDWTILVGNIAASIEGSYFSSADAVTRALATGIAQN